MFLLDLITPNRRSPGWQFILFSVLFLTFLGLTLEYYVEMKLGYVLGITLGSLVILATIYGILVRNRGDLLEQIVESELKSNSDEYLVLEHKLDQYSKILDNPSLGGYTGAVKEMGKIRSRMNELDSQGRLYFGGLESEYARRNLKKEKESYVEKLVGERDAVIQRIKGVGDVVGDVEQERNLAINKELLMKLNGELNSTENLYDRVGNAETEALKIDGEIQRLNTEIESIGETEDSGDLTRRRDELQRLKKKITNFSKSGKSSVVTLESGDAYRYAERRLGDVNKVTTTEGKKYEQIRKDNREDEKIVKKTVQESSQTDVERLKQEVQEVLYENSQERIARRLVRELGSGKMNEKEKRAMIFSKYQDSDVFSRMDTSQKRAFLEGRISVPDFKRYAGEVEKYHSEVKRNRLEYFGKSLEERNKYDQIKGSQSFLEQKLNDQLGSFDSEISRLESELSSISGSAPATEREVNNRITEINDLLGKLGRDDLGRINDRSLARGVAAIGDVKSAYGSWKKVDEFQAEAIGKLENVSRDASSQNLELQIRKVIAKLRDDASTVGGGGVAPSLPNFQRIQVSFDSNELNRATN